MTGEVTAFATAAVRVATPLLLAALGETLSERGGVINLGIEGAMLSGALAASIGATYGGPWTGVALAAAAGLAIAALGAWVTVGAGADQIIAGTAITLGCAGVTGTVYRQVYGPAGVGLSLPTFGPVAVPGLSRLPVIGPALFDQALLTYLGLALTPLLWWLLFRTRWGLRLRAAGESPEAARAAGVPVRLIRTSGMLAGGALAGLAGASLVLAQVGTFAENMTAGRGFIAIAIVVLGGWNPLRVLLASLFFGAAMALQFLFQAMGLAVPYQLFLMLPYLLTLAVLAGARGRTTTPAALGRNEDQRPDPV